MRSSLLCDIVARCKCRSELRATQGKGYARILAEAAWKELWVDHKVPVHTFRLGGAVYICMTQIDSKRSCISGSLGLTCWPCAQESMALEEAH